MKNDKQCYAIYVDSQRGNLKISVERGITRKVTEQSVTGTKLLKIEHPNNRIRFVNEEDVFNSEGEACLRLSHILRKRVGGETNRFRQI